MKVARWKLVIFGVVLALLLLKSIDFIIGIVNDHVLIETLFPPHVIIHYAAAEFNTTDTISLQGLRNEDVAVPKPSNTIRIMAVGDSFTYGWGVKRSDSWPKQLEKTLQGKFPGKKVEVINAGAPGASPHNYVHTCDLYTNYFQPDYVIWGLTYEDINQLGARGSQQFINPPAIRLMRDHFSNIYGVFSPANFYQNLSTNTVYSVQPLWQFQADALAKKWGLETIVKMDPEVRKIFLEGLLNPAYVQLAVEEPGLFKIGIDSNDLSIATKQLNKELDLAQSECQNNKTRFLGVVFLPASAFINSSEQQYQKQMGFEVNNSMLTTTLFRDELQNVIVNHHLAFWSTLSYLRKYCGSCYFHFDGHMNAGGYKLVVERIAPLVSEAIKNDQK